MTAPFVITIARELGSGGATIGQRLAGQLEIPYLDHEILKQVAATHGLTEEALRRQDEALTPLWRTLLETFARVPPESGPSLPPLDAPTDRELFAQESAFITHVATQRSAVIIGRCGNWVLRDRPRHVSVFFHAPWAFRVARVRARHGCSAAEAGTILDTSDRNRTAYRKAMTGVDAIDARQYHLCVNTEEVGLDGACELVLAHLQRRLGEGPRKSGIPS